MPKSSTSLLKPSEMNQDTSSPPKLQMTQPEPDVDNLGSKQTVDVEVKAPQNQNMYFFPL